jgi:hypothetical protein
MSYIEFIQNLNIIDSEIAKIMYELYLDCLRNQAEDIE